MEHSKGYLVTRTIVRVAFWLTIISVAVLLSGGDFR